MPDRRLFSTVAAMPARRTVPVLAIIIILLLIVALAVVGAARHGSSTSSSGHDQALKQTATKILPSLNRLNPKFPVPDSSLTSFQAWVYGSQKAFTTIIRTIRRPQVAQLQFYDPNVMPPQSLALTAPGHVGVFVDAATITKVTTNRQPQFADVQQGGRTFRAYLVPLTTPAPLTATGSTGVLEVYQPQ